VIINPKVGDRVLSNNTDEKLSELNGKMEASLKETSAVSNGNNSNSDEEEDDPSKQPSAAKSAPCTWKFYLDQKNDALYKIGHRILLTYQKVIRFFLLSDAWFCFF
jgi:hypothetical protein